jgi:hypothetical protein
LAEGGLAPSTLGCDEDGLGAEPVVVVVAGADSEGFFADAAADV